MSSLSLVIHTSTAHTSELRLLAEYCWMPGSGLGSSPNQIQSNDDDIGRLGEPLLFWGVSAGSIDSMVANYTALKRNAAPTITHPVAKTTAGRIGPASSTPISSAAFQKNSIPANPASPSSWAGSKPACVELPTMISGTMPSAVPSSSMPRLITSYTAWQKKPPSNLPMLCKRDWIHTVCVDCVTSPGSHLQAALNCLLMKLLHPINQLSSTCSILFIRTTIHSPGLPSASGMQTDSLFKIRQPHSKLRLNWMLSTPSGLKIANTHFMKRKDSVKALETIRFSLATHRGCYGECSFCAIAVHEGRTVRWRSQASILQEARRMLDHPGFKGIIHDVGGPTANMYGFECDSKLSRGVCALETLSPPANLPIVESGSPSLFGSAQKVT